jgi:hypothetical protein
MAAPNEQQMDEIIELTEIVEEGSPQEQTDKKDSENPDAFPKENAVESKDFDEELTDILESVIDDDPKAEKEPEKDTLENLDFDDLFEDDISEDNILDDLAPLKKGSQKDDTEQPVTTSKETDDEFANLEDLIEDLGKDSPSDSETEESVEDEIISDLEKSVQEPTPEEQAKSQDKAPINQEQKLLEENKQKQDEGKVPIQEDKLTNLEQRLENLETGLENKFAQIKDEILKEINDLIKSQVKPQVTEILTAELEPLKQMIAQIEEQLNNLSIPGKDELKQIISQEILSAIEKIKKDNAGQDDLQKYVLEIVEQQLEAKISTWQKEKEALAREIGEASKYQATLQNSLERLASDIGEIKDRTSTEKINQQLEEFSLDFVTKEDFKLLASQLKEELKEFVRKHVPLAAAQVIREEINALLKSK